MDRRYDSGFCSMLADSFNHHTGDELIPEHLSPEFRARWLYEEAPFGVLVQNNLADPIFIYGNVVVQSLFQYSWDELMRLPSRLSADASSQEERRKLLKEVEEVGYISGYHGKRTTSKGKSFGIDNVTVWQVQDHTGLLQGLAALLPCVDNRQSTRDAARVVHRQHEL